MWALCLLSYASMALFVYFLEFFLVFTTWAKSKKLTKKLCFVSDRYTLLFSIVWHGLSWLGASVISKPANLHINESKTYGERGYSLLHGVWHAILTKKTMTGWINSLLVFLTIKVCEILLLYLVNLSDFRAKNCLNISLLSALYEDDAKNMDEHLLE